MANQAIFPSQKPTAVVIFKTPCTILVAQLNLLTCKSKRNETSEYITFVFISFHLVEYGLDRLCVAQRTRGTVHLLQWKNYRKCRVNTQWHQKYRLHTKLHICFVFSLSFNELTKCDDWCDDDLFSCIFCCVLSQHILFFWPNVPKNDFFVEKNGLLFK